MRNFPRVLWSADTEEVQLIVTTAFMKSAEIRNQLPNHVNLYE